MRLFVSVFIMLVFFSNRSYSQEFRLEAGIAAMERQHYATALR